MLADSALRLELHRRGKVEVLEVQADRALVGSGAHCDVRLLPDEAAVEQLIIELRDEEIFVKVCSFEPPSLLNGAPFVEARLSADALVEMGQVALRVKRTELSASAKVSTKPGSETHPIVQALGLVGLAFGFYYVLNHKPAFDSALDSVVSPPTLFARHGSACPQSAQEAAGALADESLRDAENKRERAPFYPRDGLAAVSSYERAAVCFELAGRPREAREAREAAAPLKQRMRDEQHVRHVRIERFIAQEKYDALRHEVLIAAELVHDKGDPYAAWLSALARETELRRDSQRRK
jgi:hypothetical protein